MRVKLFNPLAWRPRVAGAIETVFAMTVTMLVTVLFVAMVAYPAVAFAHPADVTECTE